MWRELQRLTMMHAESTPKPFSRDQFVQNHFELFALPVSFNLDIDLLAQRYRDLQRSVHPDRYANAPDRERRLSVQRAAQINEAYRCLRTPAARARYLLQLRGVEFDDERDTHFDSVFLMEQMALREALEKVRDAHDPMADIADLMVSIRARSQSMLDTLPALFATDTEEALRQARECVQKMQFLHRLQQEADELEEALADSL